MFGGITALLSAQVGGAVRRNVTIYGLLLVSALIAVCAVGYGLDAVHGLLTLKYGRVAASLWVAGGLFLTSLVFLSIALIVKSRRRRGPPVAAAALAAAPVAASLIGSRKGWRIGLLGVITILGVALGRQVFKTGDDDEEDA